MNSWISAYDSEKFKKEGYALIDILADYLDSSINKVGNVIRHKSPEKLLDRWENYEFIDTQQFYQDIIDDSIRVHHPRYIGHQVSVPLPELALAGLVSDLLNNGMGIYEMGEGATVLERICVREMCKTLGYPMESGGFMTNGGTLANLSALLAARKSFKLRFSDIEGVVIVSDQAHFCIERACATMGMRNNQIKKISTNEAFQMDLNILAETIADVRAGGREVMAVVASACSTATGSYDDLHSISAICTRESIWLHIDGAHGGAAILSTKYHHLLHTAHLSQSMVIDAHKMMLTPALATFVLFKDEKESYNIFEHEASYLFNQEQIEWFNLAKRTFETTKYMMSLKVFILLRAVGKQTLDDFITRQYDLADQFAIHLLGQTDFHIAHRPMSNILCFRMHDGTNNISRMNQLNRHIRQGLIENGKWYIVQTTIRGEIYLRISIMNPLTTMEDLCELIEDIRAIGHIYTTT